MTVDRGHKNCNRGGGMIQVGLNLGPFSFKKPTLYRLSEGVNPPASASTP